ncbi:hypothetical protein VNI00_013540 [Paramarasmius palmivorus]|uniref:Uncharacterized protein n=1 Tax=Paramarasmius palmivorus TaxID=297713 RepID=A0AAW0BWM7_9AGAR
MESIFRSENIEAVSHNLALQLKRSGDQPNLIVSFDVPGTETRSFSGLKIYRDLFYLPLAQLSHRWESLHITLSRYRSVEFVQKYLTPHIEGYLPSLHSLRVDLMRAGEQDVFPIDAFKFAPVLRKLIINTPDVENFPFFLHLPWAQLTSYHGSTVRDIEPVARPRQVVRRMPNLETLFEERMYVNETRPSLIRLDFLHTLALVMTMPSGVDHNAISEYFDLLSLPRLRDLRLELKHYHWSQSMAAISRFFARSTSTIRSLWLELDGAYEMSSLFIQVPHLDSLSLASVSAEVIDTLAEIDLHRNQPRFLPQLCHLSMFSKADAYYNPEDYMEESLIRFAKCRQNSTELVLDSFIKIRKESLDLMRAEGLHVRIENLAWAQTFRAF